MQNNVTELVFILDRSGSMAGFEADTIGGFNATILCLMCTLSKIKFRVITIK